MNQVQHRRKNHTISEQCEKILLYKKPATLYGMVPAHQGHLPYNEGLGSFTPCDFWEPHNFLWSKLLISFSFTWSYTTWHGLLKEAIFWDNPLVFTGELYEKIVTCIQRMHHSLFRDMLKNLMSITSIARNTMESISNTFSFLKNVRTDLHLSLHSCNVCIIYVK